MDKSVLIVTPFFAPQSHAAVFRAYKLAKYLPRFGWKPYVVTVDRNYLYHEDPSLTADLPAEVEVCRARYTEPTARGLRMALGGRDRTFAALHARGPAASAPAPAPTSAGGGVMEGVKDYALQRWVQVPDAHWTWYGPAVRAARRLIREHAIPLVLTSADPYTSHRIGRRLQRDGCRWVADLRDPHAYCRATHSRFPAVHARQRGIERAAVEHADAVTVASSAIGMILADSYGVGVAEHTHFIPTGLDEELLNDRTGEGEPTRPFPYLIFTGEYLREYGPEFFEAFAAALADPAVAARGPKILVAGRLDVNGPRVGPVVQRLGLGGHVEMLDHMPQRELYRLVRGAEAGILASSRNSLWWCLHAKLVDYLALRKPVVAMIPDPSEGRTQLTRAGLGVFLDGGRAECTRTLADFLSGRSRPPGPAAGACERFTATNQVQEFIEVFESVLSGGNQNVC